MLLEDLNFHASLIGSIERFSFSEDKLSVSTHLITSLLDDMDYLVSGAVHDIKLQSFFLTCVLAASPSVEMASFGGMLENRTDMGRYIDTFTVMVKQEYYPRVLVKLLEQRKDSEEMMRYVVSAIRYRSRYKYRAEMFKRFPSLVSLLHDDGDQTSSKQDIPA
jgi:hypothetical protein